MEKLSTSQLIMVKHEKIVDIFFFYYIGWIKPKKILRYRPFEKYNKKCVPRRLFIPALQ
jgi:hypothetical protein